MSSEADCGMNWGEMTSYYIEWDWFNSQWKIYQKIDASGFCVWWFGSCTSASGETTALIATNNADTPLPPCTGWAFVTTPTCIPSFSDCTTLATNGFVFENKIEIIPNPIENDFVIKLKDIDTNLHVTILNSLSQVVISKDFTNSQEMKLSLNQPTGIYYAKITNKENQIAYYKLIKQ